MSAKTTKAVDANLSGIIVGGSKHRWQFDFRVRMVGLALCCAIVLGAVCLVILLVRHSDKGAGTNVNLVACDSKVIKQASEVIKTTDIKQVRSLQQKIKATKNYDKDQNCEYILTKFALMYSDVGDARAQLTVLKKIHTTYSKAFTIAPEKPEQLEQELTVAETVVKQLTAKQDDSITAMNNAADAAAEGVKQ